MGALFTFEYIESDSHLNKNSEITEGMISVNLLVQVGVTL